MEGKLENAIQNDQATYDTNEAAKLLGISTKTLYAYRKQRQIGFIQKGRKILFTKKHVDEFLGNFNVNPITSKTKSHGK